jgi:hypothetical protein
LQVGLQISYIWFGCRFIVQDVVAPKWNTIKTVEAQKNRCGGAANYEPQLSHFNSASIFKSQSLEVPRYEFCAIWLGY